MILREMLWRPADPHHMGRGPRGAWDAARVLKLHGSTVKRRIASLRERGILRGVFVQPMPAVVGRQGSEHHFRYADAATKQRAFEALAREPDVWKLYSAVGERVIAILATPTAVDPRERARHLAKATGAIDTAFHHTTEWPIDTSKLTPLDLRILAAYAHDAFRPPHEIAAEAHVGARTVSTRMRALERARAFQVQPLADPTRMHGGLTVYLDLAIETGSSDSVHAEIADRFPLAICRSVRGAENGCVIHHAVGPDGIEEMLRRAQGIPGARRVDVHILHDVRQDPARWRDALLARAEELAIEKGMWSTAWRAKPEAHAPPAPGKDHA